MLTEAFETLEKAYVDGWRDSQLRDTDGRERLWQAMQIIGLVRKHLEIAVLNGQVGLAAVNEIGRTTSAHRK